jgi:hypothetical protein
MAWCLVKHRENFIFLLHQKSNSFTGLTAWPEEEKEDKRSKSFGLYILVSNVFKWDDNGFRTVL